MKKYAPAALIVVVGLAQMVGRTFEWPVVAGVGMATGASPAPKVFSSVRGLETFSTRFFLEWTEEDGQQRRVSLSPERVARLKGPYNRRNIYGAVLAYGPILSTNPATRRMFQAVMRSALGGDRPLLRELGIDTSRAAGPVRIRLEPAPGKAPDPDVPLLIEIGAG